MGFFLKVFLWLSVCSNKYLTSTALQKLYILAGRCKALKKNMKYIIQFLFLFIIQISYPQGTENYENLINQLVPVRTENIVEKYNNGNIKRTAFVTYYNINGEEYGVYTGKYIKYLKNGKISWERDNDMVGAPLIFKLYYGGELFSIKKTIELDTNSKKVEEFLYNRQNTSEICEYEEYVIDENGDLIIKLKGILINNKRSGLWTTLKNGKIKKTKTYKDRDKFENLPKTEYIKI